MAAREDDSCDVGDYPLNGGSMVGRADGSGIWAKSPERWVPLRDVLRLVQAALDITPTQAARIIRGELEGATQLGHAGPGIRHRVIVPLAPFPEVVHEAARVVGMGEELHVAVSRIGGWGEVDWDAGTIRGQVIEIDWPATQHALRTIGVARRTSIPVTDASPLDQPEPRAVRPGPPRIDYRQSDAAPVKQMHDLILDRQARNPTDAARVLVGQGGVEGTGNQGSQVTRLVRHYYKMHPRT